MRVTPGTGVVVGRDQFGIGLLPPGFVKLHWHPNTSGATYLLLLHIDVLRDVVWLRYSRLPPLT